MAVCNVKTTVISEFDHNGVQHVNCKNIFNKRDIFTVRWYDWFVYNYIYPCFKVKLLFEVTKQARIQQYVRDCEKPT